jgi:hypothetical protein
VNVYSWMMSNPITQTRILYYTGILYIKYKRYVNPREEYIFLNLHTMSAKQKLTAGPANYISQIFYFMTGGFIYISFAH